MPIRYIYNPNDDSLERGWFVYNNTLIIPNVFSFEYNAETENWNYCCEIIEDDDTEKRENSFLIYDENREEMLKSFCNMNS